MALTKASLIDLNANELIDESVDLSDRTFRDAWEYTADASKEKTSADLSAEYLAKYNMTENL